MVAWSDHVADVTLDELHVELMYIRSTTTPSTSSACRPPASWDRLFANGMGPGRRRGQRGRS